MQVRGWYAGAATLMLAAAALILKRTAERIAVVVFALFCVCMVVGIKPIFGLVSGLPGFSAAHNERLLIYFLLCIALLAGWGIDDLSAVRLPRPSLRRAVLISAGVIVCIPIVWLLAAGTLSLSELGGGLRVAWGFEHPPLPASGLAIPASTGAIIRDSSLLIWLPLAGAAFALIAARLWGTRRLGVTPFVALTVIILAADLFRANMGFNPAIRQKTAVPPTTGAIRYLQSQRPNRFIGVSTIQLSQPLPDDLSMHFGLYDARGYDFPVEKRFDDLWRASVAPGVGDFTQPEEFASATPAALRALSLLSVSDLLVGPLQAIATPLHAPGLHVAYKGKDGVVYSNSNALPRVFVVDRQRTVAGDKAELAAVTAPGFNGRGVAVTDHPLPGIQQSARHRHAAGGRERASGLLRRREGRDRRDRHRPQPAGADRLVLPRVEGDRRRQAGVDRARGLRAAGSQHRAGTPHDRDALPARELADRLDREPGGAARTAGSTRVRLDRDPPPAPRSDDDDDVSDTGYTPQSMPERTRHALAARGARPVVGDLARWGTNLATGLPWTLAGSHGDFELDGRRYRYLYDRHKFTWLTERAVEVPVAQALVDQHAPDRVLEIGNVLSHYRPQQHVVVDKYEQAPGVLNRDVLDLGGLGRFDLVVAISTLEHVGWDESPRDPAKAQRAVEVLRSLLAPGGMLAITVPVGYNTAFDAALRSGQVPLHRAVALRRAGGTRWREVAPAEVWSAPYDFLLYRARGVLFGFIAGPAG